MAPGRRWLALLTALCGLVSALPPPAPAQVAESVAAAEKVMRLIGDGRNLDAIAAMKSTLSSLPPSERQDFFQFAARNCLALWDLDCARDVGAHGLQGGLQLAQAHPATIGSSLLLADAISVMTGQPFTDVQRRGAPPAIINPATDPVLFADLELMQAWQAVRDQDLDSARDHVDKALASTLSLPFQQFDAARLLLGIGRQLVANDEIERAFRLVIAAEPILRALPPRSFLRYEHLHLLAILNAYARNHDAAAHLFREALSVLDGLQLAPLRRTELRAGAHSDLLGVEVMRGDRVAIAALLAAHPLAPGKPSILARGHFASVGEFDFAAAEILARAVLQDRSDTGWLPLLASSGWTSDPDRQRAARALREIARGLALEASDPPEARRAFVEAGRLRVAALLPSRGTAFLSPPAFWTDRVVLSLAAEATLSSAAPDFALVLRSQVILGRSLASSPDDTLTLQARQPGEGHRRAVQSLRAMDYRRRAWEKEELAVLARRLIGAAGRPPPTLSQERLDLLAVANDFIVEHRRLLQVVSAGASEKDRSLADLSSVQRQLRPEEALVFYLPLFGKLGKVCIRRDGAAAALQQQVEGDATDARLLWSALTATHAASIEADSAFPAEAAVRMRHLLFGGLDGCLKASPRVYHIAPRDLAEPVPPAVLLDAVPPRLGSGFDLRQARWLIRDHAFVRTASVETFVATKLLSRSRHATLDYLGVGDPVLRPRQAATPSLAALQELPETTEELRRVAGLFDASRVRVLDRDQAREERFRLQPLSEFDIIHFATHGVFLPDLPGLSEPALVLTPADRGDAFDDGLLTASQIATLPLRTRLVVLSACNSARYEDSLRDNGIQGLSAAFAIAGVPATIAAQWTIDSRLTRDLIVATFERARGPAALPVADALVAAVRRHLDGSTPRPLLHPRFWGALISLGDGALRLDAADPPAIRELGPFANVDASADGEILAAAPLAAGFVSSEIGPWNGKRSPSLVRRRAIDGTATWQVADALVGAGPVAAAEGSVFVGGYESSATDADTVEAVLRRITADGKVAWKRKIPANTPRALVAAVAAAPDGQALALAGPMNGRADGADYTLHRFDADGSPLRHHTLTFTGDSRWRLSAILRVHGRRGLVVSNRGPVLRMRADGLNALGLPAVCREGRTADLVLLDTDGLREERRSRIEGFEARDALPSGSGWIVVGDASSGCDGQTRAAAYVLTNDGAVRNIWTDPSSFETTAVAARQIGDDIEIVGRLRRSFAVREDRRPTRMPDFATLRSGNEAFLSDEVLAVRLAPDGTERQRDWVGAGLPIWPMGMASSSGHSVIVGSVGARPLWLPR